jgi:hypothetical protein
MLPVAGHVSIYLPICLCIYLSSYLYIYLSSSIPAVAVSHKPNAIPLRFSIDLVLNFSLSWLLVLLPSTCFFGFYIKLFFTKNLYVMCHVCAEFVCDVS